MDISAEDLWKMTQVELLALYHKARCLHAEKKFARDTERGRLNWMRAKMFASGSGGVTERSNAVDASEELAKKGQHVREMTRDVDLIRADVAVIALCLRLRGMGALTSGADEREPGNPQQDEEDA